jgi:DNA ligase-1
VSELLVQRALAQVAGIDATRVAQRMMGYTDARHAAQAPRYLALLRLRRCRGGGRRSGALDAGQPYPFFLAHPLPGEPEALGDPADWLAEWKVDGIRAQLVRRAGQAWIWSRGEELVTERFPEIVELAARCPTACVLDGEVLAWRAGRDRRRRPSPAAAAHRAQDADEEGAGRGAGALPRLRPAGGAGRDCRAHRRSTSAARALEAAAAGHGRGVSPLLQAGGWAGLRELRAGVAPARLRGPHAQAPRGGLRRGPAQAG